MPVEKASPPAPPPYHEPAGATRDLEIIIDGRGVRYAATAEWLVLRKRDKPVADLFSVFYRVQDPPGRRPVTFVFNGGPGASSAYLHMGALGPTRVAFHPDGSLLPPPVHLVDNEATWLAFSDLVFVDPVGTGFSRPVDPPEDAAAGDDKDATNKEFFGLNRDLESLCEFISRFLSRHRLWSHPVFIAGESYGGFRVGKLARKLQEGGYGVGLNGAVLISPALELALLNTSDYDVLMWSDLFPSMALAAFHHGRSRAFGPGTSADQVREAAERFATTELVLLLAQGEFQDAADRRTRYDRMADFLGVSNDFVEARGGRVGRDAFVRELLREQRLVCGLYDATATAIDPFPDRDSYAGADPTLYSIERVFTGAINVQLRETLGVDSDRDYRLLNMDVNETWKNDARTHAFDTQVGATDDLRYGMGLNPHMRVFICHGQYDLVTPYFASERIFRHMKLHPDQQARISLRSYGGGHMFYTWEASRQSFYRDMQAFYRTAVEAMP